MALGVAKRNPKQCKALMNDLSEIGWPAELDKSAAELEKLIGKYKFKEAGVHLSALLQKLHELADRGED